MCLSAAGLVHVPGFTLLRVCNGLEIACPWLLVLHWSYELLLWIL